jgi:hypothetical protein
MCEEKQKQQYRVSNWGEYNAALWTRGSLTFGWMRRPLGVESHTDGSLHLVVDSTGCKVYGEGEWKVRLYGASKRRKWRKLHIGVDEQTGKIVTAVLSSNNLSDSEALPQLLEQVEGQIVQICGDGGYDKRHCYEVLQRRQEKQDESLKVTIPPRPGSRLNVGCAPKRVSFRLGESRRFDWVDGAWLNAICARTARAV